MNRLVSIRIILLLFLIGSCESPEDFSGEYTDEGVQLISATFMDGTGGFFSEGDSPYGETIKIIFPYFYPEESDNEIDISQMRLSANLPNNVRIEPGFAVHDLSQPLDITVTAADGDVFKHTIIGEIRKSSRAEILGFDLPEVRLSGFIGESQKTIGLVAGGMDLSNLVPQIRISPHATISPNPSEPRNFNNPVTYTVTAHDGTTAEYTVKKITPSKIAHGLRRGSGKLLWQKSAASLNFTEHMETGIATSGDYLVLNTRNADLRYYNRFTGEFAGTLSRGELVSYQFQNFFVTSDDQGNLLACNLSLPGNDFVVFKWDKDNLGAEPVQFIRITNNTGNQMGRKLSIQGDLDGDAVILGTVTFSGTVVKWVVSGGILQSQEPQIIPYSGKTWQYQADAVAAGSAPSDHLYVSGYPGDLAYVNTLTGEPIAKLDLAGAGYVANHSIDLMEFNKANYLAAIDVMWSTSARGLIYDVTVPENLGTPVSDPAYGNFKVFETAPVSAVNNGNLTGDIILQVSEDGYKMILYMLVTNGGIVAYEFDCVDVDHLF